MAFYRIAMPGQTPSRSIRKRKLSVYESTGLHLRVFHYSTKVAADSNFRCRKMSIVIGTPQAANICPLSNPEIENTTSLQPWWFMLFQPTNGILSTCNNDRTAWTHPPCSKSIPESRPDADKAIQVPL